MMTSMRPTRNRKYSYPRLGRIVAMGWTELNQRFKGWSRTELVDKQVVPCSTPGRPPSCRAQEPWAIFIIVYTHVRLPVTKHCKMVPALSWEINRRFSTCLASHWPCVTDNSDISTNGLAAREREIYLPPPPRFSWSVATLLKDAIFAGDPLLDA